MRIGSLFAGIGGLELGLEWAGVGSVAWQVECDPFCRRVLARHWPDAERFEDVREVGAANLAPVDVIAGGYPCQPFSQAGRRKGQHDERHLWPEFARVLRELRPRFAVLENVSGHLSLGFGDVLGDLAEIGYDAEWSCVRASDVGAMHRRERLFAVAWLADRHGGRQPIERIEEHPGQQGARGDEPNGRSARRRGQGASGGADAAGVADATRGGTGRSSNKRHNQRRGQNSAAERSNVCGEPGDSGAKGRASPPLESLVGRGSHGISLRLDVAPPGAEQHPWEPPRLVEIAPDRTARLRALGNAVVPQVAVLVGRRLLEIAEREGLR